MAQIETLQSGRELLTVRQFAQRFPAWTEAALRNLILNAEDRQSSRGRIPGNGLIESGAVVRVGRRVLIDVRAFFGPWIAQQQVRRKAA